MTISASTPFIGYCMAMAVLSTFLSGPAHAGRLEKFLERRALKVQEIEQRFESQPNCCESYRDMHFKPLSGKRTRVEIGPDSPIFVFAEGRSKFEAYLLPMLSAGNRLELVFVERIPRDPSPVLRPMLILLSERFEVLAVFAPNTFDEPRIGLSDEGKVASLDLDQTTSAARYAIVAADPRWIGRDLDLEARGGVFYGPLPLKSPSSALRVPYSYEGRTYLYVDTD